MNKVFAILAFALFTFTSVVSAEEKVPPTVVATIATLPAKAMFSLHPDNLPPGRGNQIEIRIIQDSNAVTGTVTMYGKGQNGCTMKNNPLKGTFDGQKLEIGVVVAPGDNFTCPMRFVLNFGPNGYEGGRFVNGNYAGNVKPD